jgi:hypothetical protein
MNRPRLLLLDEPSMGLSPIMTAEIGKIIRQINAQAVSIILVEQNALPALTLAQYGYVLETGLVVMQGNARELLQDEGVKKAYLGSGGSTPRTPGAPLPAVACFHGGGWVQEDLETHHGLWAPSIRSSPHSAPSMRFIAGIYARAKPNGWSRTTSSGSG